MAGNGKIIVGVDGSVASADALRWALDEARRRGAEVHVVTAWHTDPPPVEGPPPMVGIPYRTKEAARANALALQERIMDEVRGVAEGVAVQRHMVGQWPPRALVHASADADLLVLGRHGHSWLAEKLLGSVAAYCLRHATCPVVITPARQTEKAVERRLVEAPATPGPLY
ncbi:universal stress protein [Kutzneria sp. 744]|uniref:universal stress protein n=1 Tax=Kutzneria sp. (strain 744) TaxID=345341 RepID=UPI0003EEC847|nr:universal stress protein [Kutzneria sp. 744]EWM10216.1 universal stress protein [Kutzneria sp. 744]